jgi:hypothetical protein
LECKVFIQQLQRLFPIPTELVGNVEFGIKAEQHDFGTYREVVIRGLYNIPQVAAFATRVENNAPTCWDHPARVELALEQNFDVRYTDAPVELDLDGTITHLLVHADPCSIAILFNPLEEGQLNNQQLLLSANGNPYRAVLIPPQLVEQQVANYHSKPYLVLGIQEWEMVYSQLTKSTNPLEK